MGSTFRKVVLLGAALFPLFAAAGPKEEALAVADLWSMAYSANDVDTLVNVYHPDAVLLGTVSPVMSEGREAIRTYFGRLKGSGNTNTLSTMRFFELSDDSALVTGFYTFASTDPAAPKRPSRFTMLVTRRGGEWHIAHHHSSPLVPAAN